MSPKPCILMYTAVLSVTGGAQYTMSLFARELARRGYRITFFTRPPFDPNQRYSQMLRDAGVPIVVLQRFLGSRRGAVAAAAIRFMAVVPYAIVRRRSIRDAWTAAESIASSLLARLESAYIDRRFSAAVRENRHEGRAVILHVWGPAALTPFLLAWGKRNTVPSVYHEMGEADEAYVKMFSIGETVAAIKLADRVVCVSPTVSNTLRKVFNYEGPIESIYDMVTDPGDSWSRAQKHGGRLTFGAIGRLVPHKRHRELLRAVRALVDLGYDPGLVIASDGPMRGPLEKLARDLEIEERITFTGEFEDLTAVMAMFDVFVLISASESQCMPVTESMGYGKPVIASRFGGIPDFVDDQVTGFLVDVEDFDGLVGSMRKLIDNPTLREEMGSRARKRFVESFAPTAVGDMAERLYAGLLQTANE